MGAYSYIPSLLHPPVLSAVAGLPLLLLLLLLVIYTLKSHLNLLGTHTKRRKPNYPPIVGTIFHQLLNLHRLVDFQTEHSHKHKTFRFLAPFCSYNFTVDPANVEYILKTNFANYGKGELNYVAMNDFFGDGIFAVDGEKWRHQRKMASFQFSARVLRDYSSVVFRTTACKFARIVDELVRSKQVIEIQDLFFKSTLDSIFKIAFGVELDTLSGSNEESIAFAKAFDDANAQLLRRYFDVLWKVKRFLNVGSEATMKRNLDLIDGFLYRVIDTKINQQSGQRGNSVDREDMLSRFITERENDPENMSRKYLRDIILNFVIAGRDTTAGTLAWFFYMLCRHPRVQEKVAAEVRESTPAAAEDDITLDEFTASLTEEALNRMHYLHACLTETLRLYPAVPLNPKYCFSDDTLPDGFDVRKGDIVAYQPYAMGRMKFLWGEDAEEFRPERWTDAEGVFVPESPFKLTAFQAGPRICLGKDFSYRQMKMFAATLVYFFRFKLFDETKPVKIRAMVTLKIAKGLHLYGMRRSTSRRGMDL